MTLFDLLPIVAAVVIGIIITSCANTKKAGKTDGAEYTAETVELCGYGHAESPDYEIARKWAQDRALADLSRKMNAAVRTASSDYQRQSGTFNKTLYESLTEVISENILRGVIFTGDRKPTATPNNSRNKNCYVFDVEARINHTFYKENIESVLDKLDATAEERDAFKREMFGE